MKTTFGVVSVLSLLVLSASPGVAQVTTTTTVPPTTTTSTSSTTSTAPPTTTTSTSSTTSTAPPTTTTSTSSTTSTAPPTTTTSTSSTTTTAPPTTTTSTSSTTSTAPRTTTTTTTLPSVKQPVAGKKLLLRNNASGLRLKVEVEGIMLQSGGPSDPTTAGGSLRLASTAGVPFDHTMPLPAGNWGAIGAGGAGFRYRDVSGTAGPIVLVAVKNGKTKAIGKGAALGFSLTSNPNPVNVILTFGNARYCAAFGGLVKFTADKRFEGKQAPAPAACLP